MTQYQKTRHVLEMRRIVKRFGATTALDGVDFYLDAGEVHALVGENGAGKSTLINVISGRFKDYGGSVFLDGRFVRMARPRQTRRLGISVIHQDLRVIENFSVAENIVLGGEPVASWSRRIDRKEAVEIARAAIDRLGFDLNPEERVGDLGTARRTLVEIAAAMHRNAKVIVFDEPTAALDSHDVARLFAAIRGLRDRGLGVIYVSHRLAELPRIADRVTVLRDGRAVGTVDAASCDIPGISAMMLGRRLGEVFPPKTNRPGGILLKVRNLAGGGIKEPVSFDLREGEIVGIAGLVGSGRTEIARAIFGASKSAGGVELAERFLPRRNPCRCRRAGVGMIPENRKSQGIISGRTLAENLNATILAALSGRLGRLPRRKWTSVARGAAERLRIDPPEPCANIDVLSGGNQQKAVLGRWLACGPKILIMDEPTQGIDIGTKREVYDLIVRLAKSGCGILLISSEFVELAQLCDRVLVLRGGRFAAELSGPAITEQSLFQACVEGS